MRTICYVGLALLALCGEAHAAPTLTHLFPAGAQRGTTAEVTAAGAFDKWPVKVWVSGKGVTAVAGKEKGKLSFTVAADAVPGPYWVRVYDEAGASGLRPFVVGTLPEVAEKEPNDDPGTAQAIAPPAQVVNGRLAKAGDVDCFAVALKKGQTLVASADANHTFKSPMDAIVQVVTPDGFVLDQNNDVHGLDPQLAFAAPRAGTFVVRVFAFPSVPDSSIRFAGGDAYIYRLTLTTGGFADYPWPLAVARDAPAPVTIVGWNIPDAAKTLAVPKGEPGDTARLFHPTLANAVTVAVEPHACWDAAALAGRADPLVPPFTVSGRLWKAGQVGGFPVAAKKGVPLTLRAEAQSLGFPLSPVIVVSEAGKVLSRAEPPGLTDDVELVFNPPHDGPFTVEVRDLLQTHGPRHAYRLTVRTPDPDFTLTVPTDRVVCAPGKPADVIVTVAKKSGFAAEVAITAEGLPAGVTAAVVPATGKDAKGVTVRFTAEKEFDQVAIRIVGRAKGRRELTRTATAALTEFGTTTSELWLAPSASDAPLRKKKR